MTSQNEHNIQLEVGWTVIVNLRNGEEHTISCGTYDQALDIQESLRQLMVFGFADPEAIAQFDPDDLIFYHSYREGVADARDSFVVNPCDISSISIWGAY